MNHRVIFVNFDLFMVMFACCHWFDFLSDPFQSFYTVSLMLEILHVHGI